MESYVTLYVVTTSSSAGTGPQFSFFAESELLESELLSSTTTPELLEVPFKAELSLEASVEESPQATNATDASTQVAAKTTFLTVFIKKSL
jgi:hypothetical protein